jgi:hypothetical protein
MWQFVNFHFQQSLTINLVYLDFLDAKLISANILDICIVAWGDITQIILQLVP